MRKQNRKNVKGEKNIENISVSDGEKSNKEKIKEIEKKRREMQRKSASELAAEQEQAEAERAAAEAEQAAEAEAAAALQDYVDTYSAMNPEDAAKVFESMMMDQEDLVIRILENLTPNQRAAILSNMSIAYIVDLTVKMKQ